MVGLSRMQFYAYFKQGTQSPPFADAPQPGMFDLKVRSRTDVSLTISPILHCGGCAIPYHVILPYLYLPSIAPLAKSTMYSRSPFYITLNFPLCFPHGPPNHSSTWQPCSYRTNRPDQRRAKPNTTPGPKLPTRELVLRKHRRNTSNFLRV